MKANNIGVVLRDASIMGDTGSRIVDIYQVVKEILARASMIELRDAMRTADKFGDDVAVQMFRREINRRLAE